MADNKYILLMFVCCCVCCVSCDLNLKEGDICHTHGHNGTCVELFDCNSAALTHLLEEAGYDGKTYKFPKLPKVCSYKGDTPIVCCTDCHFGSAFRDKVIAPMARIKPKKSSVAWRKCYDYFKRLPYPCRGAANVHIKKIFNEVLRCHSFEHGGALGVGGRDAEKWEFPHMALLGYGETAVSADWLCGGSVISERFILTAAHCSSTRALGPIKYAALGLLKRSDPKENWKIYNIKRIILHPEYNSPSKYHDIALLETETEINFGRDLLPACLDISDNDRLDSSAEAAGWGRLGHNQGLADTLQVVILSEFSETQCGSMYPPHRHLKRGYDHKTQMCYGSHYAIIDTCDGDSGGPLQKSEYKCLYHVVGVTSYGRECGILGSAGMYTRVSHYVPWIESIVWPGETISDELHALPKVTTGHASNCYTQEAGLNPKKYGFPDLPDTCSYKGDKRIVCCTDCKIGYTILADSYVGPLGVLVNTTGPVAWKKCYDYFKRLPYPCRGSANIEIHRHWNDTRKCHEFNIGIALAVGGRDAERWEFPHMALLGYGDTVESADWLCGGSVISERFILTAAHCSSSRAFGSIKYAALGLLKRTDPKENWKIYNIKRIIVHPEYKSPSIYHDIALLETETEINFGRDLLPACLDVGNELYHIFAEAAGWGRLGYRQGLADNLQVVELDEFNETECSSLYPPHRHLTRGYDHQTQMCYGSHSHIVDTCDGDSGGPLQWNDHKCLYRIVGVTSYGKDCGILGAAGMYTRVSHYVPWIENIVWPENTNSDN